jgi:enoyl-CoA hydratase
MTAHTEILFSEISGKDGNIGLITLNRPAVLNALNHNMIIAMTKHLSAWQHDHHIKAVIIDANGDRAFCAGGDLRHTHSALEPFFRDEYLLNQLIFHYTKPYIALLDGITMGGGVGISIHGSHRVVSEKVLFAMPETGIGFFPDVGGTYFLPRLQNRTGYYLGLTGARIKSDDCVMLGIAQHKVPHASFGALRDALVNTAFGADPKSSVTNIINQFSVVPEAASLTPHLLQLNDWFAKPSVEEIIETLESVDHPFAVETVAMLVKKSPASLKVTLAALQRGQQLSFDDCMKMEYHLVCQFLKEHDFAEGIRAVIIDKDLQPKWQPATLAAMTPAMVNAYF